MMKEPVVSAQMSTLNLACMRCRATTWPGFRERTSIPDTIFEMANETGYSEFLQTGRKRMAAKIRGYYEGF